MNSERVSKHIRLEARDYSECPPPPSFKEGQRADSPLTSCDARGPD